MTSNKFSSRNEIDRKFVSSIQSGRVSRVVSANLRRYNLVHRCNLEEIMSEAYIRAISAYERGKVIHDMEAWLIVTTKNIIREETRRLNVEQNRISIESVEDFADLMGNLDRLLNDDLADSVDVLKTCMSTLSTKDYLIVLWRSDGVSWQEIQIALQAKGYDDSLENLRKRYGRIISRLRSAYGKKQFPEDSPAQSISNESEQLTLSSLSYQDSLMLDLRLKQGLSWQKIGDEWIAQGLSNRDPISTAGTLRQRFSRLQKRLQASSQD